MYTPASVIVRSSSGENVTASEASYSPEASRLETEVSESAEIDKDYGPAAVSVVMVPVAAEATGSPIPASRVRARTVTSVIFNDFFIILLLLLCH